MQRAYTMMASLVNCNILLPRYNIVKQQRTLILIVTIKIITPANEGRKQ